MDPIHSKLNVGEVNESKFSDWLSNKKTDVKKTRKFQVGDKVAMKFHYQSGQSVATAGTVTKVRSGPLSPRYYMVNVPVLGREMSASANEMAYVDDFIEAEISKDPGFVKSEFFRVHASPKQKSEYPEAGADFGFFDAKKTNESHVLPYLDFLLEAKGQADKVKRVVVDGFEIVAGRNSEANDKLTFQVAGDDDFWFHVKGFPSAHVVILSGGREVPEEVIMAAAQITAENSVVPSGDVPVIYCLRRYVTKEPHHNPGQVSVDYVNSKVVFVKVSR